MSRAHAIRTYLVAHPESSLSAIVGAINCQLPNAHNVVAAQLAQMVKAKMVARSGRLGESTYSATSTALVDRRRKGTTGARVRRRATADARVHANHTKAAPRRAAPPQTPATRPTRPPRVISVPPSDRRLSPAEQIAADVAAYLKRGGKIQRLQPGESSRPIFESLRQINERTMERRKAIVADQADAAATPTQLKALITDDRIRIKPKKFAA